MNSYHNSTTHPQWATQKEITPSLWLPNTTGGPEWIHGWKDVAECSHCLQSKVCTTKKKTPLYHIPRDPSMWPFNVITLDLITQLLKANGHDAILTIMDQGCSWAATFVPCNTTTTGEGVALLYMKYLLPWFGVPSKVILDRDPCFTSHFAKAANKFCVHVCCQHHTPPSVQPWLRHPALSLNHCAPTHAAPIPAHQLGLA